MAQAAGADFSVATDYADYLARKGMPFREAHRIVGELVRACEARGCGLADLSLQELRAASPLFEADAVGLTAADSVRARDVLGGTAPGQVEAALAQAQTRLDALVREVALRREPLPSLDRLLADPLEVPSPTSQAQSPGA